MQEPIRIEGRRIARLARELYQEVRDALDDMGRKEPIARIEVSRLIGEMFVHCFPVRLVRKRRA